MAFFKDQVQIIADDVTPVSGINIEGPLASDEQYAQTFIPSVSGDLTKVYVALTRLAGAPFGDVVCAIQGTSGGEPDGTDLATANLDSSNFNSNNDPKLAEFVFGSPPTLSQGTTYAIVLRAESDGEYRCFSSDNASVSGNGLTSTDGGTNWTVRTFDIAFVTEMDTAVAEPALDQFGFGNSGGGSADRVESSTEFRAQTFVPSFTSQLDSVELGISTVDGQTAGSITVEIQGVDGSNKPDGTAIASATVSDSVLPTNADSSIVIDITDHPELTASVTYAIVIKFPDASGSARYEVNNSGEENGSTSGQHWLSTDSGSTWNDGGSIDVDLMYGTYMFSPVETTQTIDSDATVQITTEQTIDSDAFVGEETTQTIDSDAIVFLESEQTIDSDAFIGEETTQTIDSDATIGATTTQTIDSDAFVGEETTQTIDSDATVELTTEETIDSDAVIQISPEQTIDSDALIQATTVKTINAKASVSITNSQTIDSEASITVNVPELSLFSSAAPTVPIGTASNPLVFSGVTAGEILEHPDNPFYLWNDKGGIKNSVDARNVTVRVLSADIDDELVGVSNGTVDQTFTVAYAPVVEGETDHPLIVKVGGVTWTLTNDLSTAGQFDEVYEFDFVTGEVTFGDDINGAIPGNGENIEISYTPNQIGFGLEVEDLDWLGVQSTGVITNSRSIFLEQQISTDDVTVQADHTPITTVSGVFLRSDPNRLGTNYFSGGTFDSDTGIITLATALPSANEDVLIDYEYVIDDDVEDAYTQVGQLTSHTFVNPIPSNNAKHVRLRMVPPDAASPSGVMDIKFRIKITFNA